MTITLARAMAQCLSNSHRLALGTALASVLAFGAQAQSYTFTNVSVQGNQRIETGTILTYAGIARGETVSAAAVNDAAQAIRETGLFETVEVIPQGNTLVIQVAEYPTINLINFEGNARLSNEELAEIIGSQERRVYSPAQAERDVAAIVGAYAQQGRINAVVVPSIIRRSDNRVDLVFEIVEGGLTEIERIGFVGNRSFSDRRLRGVLETKQAGLLRAIIRSDTFVAERIDFDRQVLTDFYRSRGYIDFEVLNVDVTLTRERDAHLITFNIREGQQFRLGNISVASEIAGADPALFERALNARSGTIYSPTLIENDIVRLERLAIREGLDFVHVEPRITRNDRALTLDLEYALVPGPRIFVERIDIEGNTTTLDRVIRNQFRVVEGDPFNPRQIRESAERIRALGYFANASVEAREGSSPDQVVIDVAVEEQPTGTLSFGVNYNSDTGASLVASFSERNFLGRGQQLAFQISTSKTDRLLSFDFTEPNFLGRDLAFSTELTYRTTNNEYALYDTENIRFSPQFAFPVSQNARMSVFYAYDYADITDVADRASLIIQNEADLGAVGTNSLGYSYSYDSRRSGLDPSSGIALRFAQEFGIGDASFIRTTARAMAETRLWNDDLVLNATIEGGMLSYEEGSSRVTDRFFMGSRTMRGFQPGGIGPRDADTLDALGGNYFAVARLEAGFPLPFPEEYGLSGGAFIDYGSVWDVGETYGVDVLYNEFTPRTVAGLSLFWATPLGPLRFNFTEPLDVQPEDRPKSFDLTISAAF